jgi:tRNA(adenine34) deaminase
MVPTLSTTDHRLMRRSFELAIASACAGEYPYGVVITRRDVVIAESINRVARDGDVTRHAEVVAISAAQRAVGSTSLDDCAIYVSVEPCAFCCYAIRESRIAKVAYGLRSPVMGGVSRWNILEDKLLSDKMPEVFAPPPHVLHCFLPDEAEAALRNAAPIAARWMEWRGLFVRGAESAASAPDARRSRRFAEHVRMIARKAFFDRFGRRAASTAPAPPISPLARPAPPLGDYEMVDVSATSPDAG